MLTIELKLVEERINGRDVTQEALELYRRYLKNVFYNTNNKQIEADTLKLINLLDEKAIKLSNTTI